MTAGYVHKIYGRNVKRDKEESSILFRFHFSNFKSFFRSIFNEIFVCSDRRPYFLNLCMFQVTFFFSFIKSTLLKIRSHVPSTVWRGKEGITLSLQGFNS